MLSEKVAVITGGSSGIGFSIAKKFAEHGVNLILISKSESSLNAAKGKLSDYPINISCVSGDLSKVENIPAVVDSVLLLTNRIDFFINNAGLVKFASVEGYTTENFDSLFDFNVKVPFLFIKSFLPNLIQHQGTIVNISTYWSHKMIKGRYSSLYSASRGAMVSMVKALANELSEYGVRINSISPGSTQTETFNKWKSSLNQEQLTAFETEVHHSYPLKRLGNAEDVANAVYFLASDQAAWITGQIINVDGGFTIR